MAFPVTAFHTPTVPPVSATASTPPFALTAASIGALGCLTSSGLSSRQRLPQVDRRGGHDQQVIGSWAEREAGRAAGHRQRGNPPPAGVQHRDRVRASVGDILAIRAHRHRQRLDIVPTRWRGTGIACARRGGGGRLHSGGKRTIDIPRARRAAEHGIAAGVMPGNGRLRSSRPVRVLQVSAATSDPAASPSTCPRRCRTPGCPSS